MDGAKPAAETTALLCKEQWGKQASCLDRSLAVKPDGPGRNENPGNSKRVLLENSKCRKGQGSWAMPINPGLAGPNCHAKRCGRKGKWVNIPTPPKPAARQGPIVCFGIGGV